MSPRIEVTGDGDGDRGGDGDLFDPWLDVDDLGVGEADRDGAGRVGLDGDAAGGGRGAGDRPGGRGLFDSLDGDPRVAAGIDHFQRAAKEMIAASRALLDVAEELVESPDGVAKVVEALGDLGSLARRTAGGGSSAPSDEGPGDDPPVQRIPVS